MSALNEDPLSVRLQKNHKSVSVLNDILTERKISLCDLVLDGFALMSVQQQRECLTQLFRAMIPAGLKPHWGNQTLSSEEFRHTVCMEIENIYNTQSTTFMVEILPYIVRRIETIPRREDEWLTALDVGSRTGAGTALLGDVGRSATLRLHVDSLDIDPKWRDYQISRYQSIRSFTTKDLYALAEKSYDVVICSHTIEHFDDPRPFIAKMQKIARHFVAIYCPFEENDLIADHRRVDNMLVDELRPIEKHVFNSIRWKKSPVVYFALAPS